MTYYTKPGSVTVWATTPHGEMEVARVGPATRPMTLRRADARLFAAAPDLMHAARCAIADLEGLLPEIDPSGDREHPAWATLADLQAAVIKALEGQR